MIITARHPSEGGQNGLSAAQREVLFLRFLPFATFLDLELRSLPRLEAVRQAAIASHIQCIVSIHALDRALSDSELGESVAKAQRLSADVLKVVSLTDTAAQLDRLLAFFEREKTEIPLSVMGTGRLGRASRRELLLRGSVLNYGHLGRATVTGQLTLPELRSLQDRATPAPAKLPPSLPGR